MKRAILLIALVAALATPAHASAAFGLSGIEVFFEREGGAPEQRSGAHPFAVRTSFKVNTVEEEGGAVVVDGALRDLDITLPEGFAGNPTAAERCQTLDFLKENGRGCPDAAALGTLLAEVGEDGLVGEEEVAIYNLHPAPGEAAKLGFWVGGVPINLSVGLTQSPPYRVEASLSNTSQIVEVIGSVTTIWGNPADPDHDLDRGRCAYPTAAPDEKCPVEVAEEPFVTMPRSCTGPLETDFRALSWWSGEPTAPGPPASFATTVLSPGMQECSGLEFSPELDVQPTSSRAAAPSGLQATLRVEDEGLTDPEGRAASDLKEARVVLPKGMTINPSQAEGLATCSVADLARESASSPFGAGCPAASKIGTVEVETPLLEGQILKGSLFVAEPYANPFGSLLAIYQVIKSPELGIVVKLPGRVEPDLATGQIVTTFGGAGTDPLPQVPFSEFRLRFREGGRSPLVMPNACGTYRVTGTFVPWAHPAKPVHESLSDFQVSEGPDGGPCPPAGPPPFEPGFEAGTISNTAGAHSPFAMRLTRRDGDADLVRCDATLPPGLVARLAGVARCPDAAIATADARSGKAELASPSCPAGSQIGTVKAGAGAGSQLTYVPGRVYLAGPFAGAPLSVAAVVPAVAGPFDVGTVVTRQALVVDPVSAAVRVDGKRSEPIPHILAGIPLRVRDIQVDVDRPRFTLNPTSCAPMSIGARISGGGVDPFSAADDTGALRSVPFQAADCAHLGFRPRLGLRLLGGTRRGANPALQAVLRPRPDQANPSRAIVRLPRSAFLDQAHIRTICTRVQFAADSCPKGSIYGHVSAFSPLLDEPLSGPAYLRSSDNDLPDLVFDLKGLIDVEASARIDSIGGGIRATFPAIPDAPLSKVVVRMQGGKKGLIVNSRNLCRSKSRAAVRLDAHSGKRVRLRPVLRPQGCEKRRGKRSRARRAR
ncbi:MAG TPA: hypothetical protein VEQ41_07430 [Solirubrobacterales bacterium]|nr:hypothetical protein [Solirubrobacterales bacterium]